MKLSGIDKIVWALSFYGNIALLAVLLVRGRWRQFPIFTCFIAFDVARSIALYLLYSHGLMAWYAHVYWWALLPDFGLQVGVILEIARIVLRPTGTWVQDARLQFAAAAAGGVVVAAVLAWWVSPPAQSALAAWRIRGNLFTSLVICELFVVMTLTANRLGLGWRSHVMAIGQGLTAWSSVMVVTTALQSYVGPGFLFRELDQVRAFAYIAAIFWMMARLWIAEPARQPLAHELEQYILALHKRVAYDLQRIDAGS
ncbi:MAG: hypothetical protein WA294_04855 [Acidobacteriaceae bacterium]